MSFLRQVQLPSFSRASHLNSHPFFFTYQKDKSSLLYAWELSPRLRFDIKEMKTKQYFEYTRKRSDRAAIKDQWIERVIDNPAKTEIQKDARIKKWEKNGDSKVFESRFVRGWRNSI
jgi:hypothetical protein